MSVTTESAAVTDVSKRNVTVFLWRIGIPLVLKELQRPDELRPGELGLNYLVDKALFGGDIRVSKLFVEFVNDLLPFFFRVRCVQKLPLIEHANRTLGTHDSDLGGRISKINVR